METINTYYEDYISLEKFVGNNRELFLGCGNRAVLVQIFSGVYDKNYLVALSGQIRELIPQAQVIGTTTNGEIMNGLVSGLKTVLSFSAFCHSNVKAAFAEKKNDDYELGRSIAAGLNSDKARILILFSTGQTVNAGHLLRGVQSVNAGLPVAGGNAGDNRTNTKCFVCSNEDITDSGAAGVILEGDKLTVTCHNHLGWQPIGKEMTITRAEGSRVYTIDHIPAYQVYCQYLGIDTISDIINGSEFPLTICKHGQVIARSPNFRHDDDSISFFGDVKEGDKVRFSFGHVGMILSKIGGLLQTIKQQPAESIFVYSCGGRRCFLQNSTQIETLPLQNIAPTSGFFTSGEFFHADNSNMFLNATMTTVALSESGGKREAFVTTPGAAASLGKENCDVAAVKDNLAYRSIEVLKALTHLIKQSEEEIKYLSYHDKLTGLYNRTFFEEELKRISTGRQLPLGLIIGDVNGLKLINDAMGHLEGDKVLIKAAEIFRKSCRQEDIVSRWGGDEFIVLLPRCDGATTLRVFERINDSFISINSLPIQINISLGMAIQNSLDQDIRDVIREAEEKMYRNKLLESRSTRGSLIKSLEKTLWERSHETEEHCRRMQEMAQRIGRALKLTDSELDNLRLLAALHDIGKIAIPGSVLDKPGILLSEEWETVKNHSEIGYRIALSSPELASIAEAVLHHHERWDGSGYPLGLKGEKIPLLSRIIAITDTYDVMTNGRPYKKAVSKEEALAEIKRCAGTQFDPELVKQGLFFD